MELSKLTLQGPSTYMSTHSEYRNGTRQVVPITSVTNRRLQRLTVGGVDDISGESPSLAGAASGLSCQILEIDVKSKNSFAPGLSV